MDDLVGDRKSLLIRADASVEIGSGHLMRCLALAQAWQAAGGPATFASVELPPALQERLQMEEIDFVLVQAELGSTEDAGQTAQLAHSKQAAWIVADGYAFGEAYQQILKQETCSLLVLDDYGHADHYYADMILNQNLGAKASLYARREPYTRLLLGTRYALLRREFWVWRRQQRGAQTKGDKLLVTLGGADPDGVVFKVIEALAELEIAPETVLVVGGSNPHYTQICEAVQKASLPAEVRRNVANMSTLMAWADMAVSAGGSTCWELAFMGVPNVVIVLADNQHDIAAGLDDAGVSINLGWHEQVHPHDLKAAIAHLMADDDTRSGMARRGRLLVDGLGGQRVMEEGFMYQEATP